MTFPYKEDTCDQTRSNESHSYVRDRVTNHVAPEYGYRVYKGEKNLLTFGLLIVDSAARRAKDS